MHSRIYQLSSNPIDQDDFIEADNFEYLEQMDVAEYVQDSDRNADIEWLESLTENYGGYVDRQDDTITFSDRFEINHFADRYMKLKQMVADMSLDEFAKDWGLDHKLTQLIEDDCNVYVLFTDEYDMTGLYTFDSFVRMLSINKDSRTFYIGGTLDYHG